MTIRPGEMVPQKGRVRCPHCGAPNDAATSVNATQRPEDGDLSICAECWQLALFCEGATAQRMLTPQELEDVRADPQMAAILQAVEKTRRERGH